MLKDKIQVVIPIIKKIKNEDKRFCRKKIAILIKLLRKLEVDITILEGDIN